MFELFIFSDLLEINRDILIEGNSLILTLRKNITDDDNRFKRINVTKIASISNQFNKPISNIEFNLNDFDKLEKISNILEEQGNTNINIHIKDKNRKLIFNLKKKRKIDKNSLSSLKNDDISTIIN